MLKAAAVLFFLVLPEFAGDCLIATDPHVPPSTRVNTLRARQDGSPTYRWPRERDHGSNERCLRLAGHGSIGA